MSIFHFLQRLLPVRPLRVTCLMLVPASCAMLGANVTGWAADPKYNPDRLAPAQLELVSDICQTVMGLSADEPLTGGDWLGEPRLDYETSHYRVCIISLSDSLQDAADARLTQEVDVSCRSNGFAPGSSELALCVLQGVNERAAQSRSTQSAAGLGSRHGQLPRAPTSYYRASPHDYVHREQLACAALGLDPAQISFTTCVKNMNHALYSIENPIH